MQPKINKEKNKKGKGRKYKAKKKYSQLCCYLNKSDKYEHDFLLTVEYDLFDYAIILSWKTFMLFLYERIYQIIYITRDELFLKKWQRKFSKHPKNYKPKNIYWPNQEDDDKVIAFIGELYNIESNFIKQLRNLKSKRDIAAHVADDSLSLQYHQLKSYLTDLIIAVKKIQECHEEEYFKKIEDFKKIAQLVPSSEDLKILVDILIEKLKHSSSFKKTEEYENTILIFKQYLNIFHIEKIFKIVFENPENYSINQIINADGTVNFLKELFDINIKNKKKWEIFYKALVYESIIRDLNIMDRYDWLAIRLNLKKQDVIKKIQQDIYQ